MRKLMICLVAVLFLAATGVSVNTQDDVAAMFAKGKDQLPMNLTLHDSNGREYYLTYFAMMGQNAVYIGSCNSGQEVIATWNAPWMELSIESLPNDSYYGGHTYGMYPGPIYWTHNNAGGVTWAVTIGLGPYTVAPPELGAKSNKR